MRIRAVVVLSLIILGLSFGCRNALSPTGDRNRAPETWITAAPQDTVSVHESNGTITPPIIRAVPTRFHMYWAGSDADGAVVGFYWAVVETLPVPPEGTSTIPPLPGPRTSQYQFTTRTDSIFSFSVSEFRYNRQHAFYIYAVDDKGRGDPTPARFIFDALDRFPPLPVFDVSEGRGKFARVVSHGVVQLTDVTVPIRDTVDLHSGRAPDDTIPSGAVIDFRWHGEPTIAGNYAVRYKYKLDEPFFVEVDSSVKAVSYNTGLNDRVNPGTKQFILRAIDAAGGARSGSEEVTRRFQMNRNPDTWYAGPDSNLVPAQVNDPVGRRYLTMHDWSVVPSGSGSLLSCDSLYLWPAERPERKTFWEVYGDKLFLRAENDTVNMNGFIIIQPGGSDPDSPYRVNVNPNSPVTDTVRCGGDVVRVVHPSGPNGSPIGFRFGSAEALDPHAASISIPSPSALFPLFDATSTSEQKKMLGQTWFTQSGRVYFVLRAVDGDGAQDDRLADAYSARLLADAVDAHVDTDPYDVALREHLILTFYVNRNPYFDVGQPQFFPKPTGETSPDRVLRMNLLAIDPDPYDPANKPPSPGYPSTSTVLRTRVTVRGTNEFGRDTTYVTPPQFTARYNIDLPSDAAYIRGTHLTLTIELCDCAFCEQTPGSGRCVTYGPVSVDVPASTAVSSMGTQTKPTGTKPQAPSSRRLTP